MHMRFKHQQVPYQLLILMCYFYVKFNVKKRNLPNELVNMVLKNIDFLHFSKSQSKIETRKIIKFNKWDHLKDFKRY